MASAMAAIRGLGARNTMTMYASMARTGLRTQFNTTAGTRFLLRAAPKTIRIGYGTTGSAARLRSLPKPQKSKNQILSSMQHLRSRLFHTARARRSPQNPNPTPNLRSPPKTESLTLGQRMRKLSREYGWAALGVYLSLSTLDFPFCYLLVRYLGTERIGEWEHLIVSNVERLIPESVKRTYHEWRQSVKQAEKEMTGHKSVNDHVEMAGWGVEEAQERNKRDASLATQLALAYAIHKSFIFIRVPLAAATTPKVVKVLRGWGWDIGKRTTKEAKAIKRATNS